MILLTPDKYHLALPVLREVRINNLFARSVIEHHVAGKVYVDNAADPHAFYVIHPYGMTLLFGRISEEFFRQFLQYITGSTGEKGSAEFVQVFPAELENRIDGALGKTLGIFNSGPQDLSGYSAVKYKRFNFAFNPENFSAFLSDKNVDNYTFSTVDELLFNEFEGRVVPKQFWDSPHDFDRNGVGYSLMDGGLAIATAFSAFRHDDMLELGMETRKAFRRQGLGGIICARLITHCLRNDLEPIWACGSGNPASYNLAVKLGFEPVASLPYYII